MEVQILNEARKNYHEPMHTAEHILNQTMVRMFGCSRSVNAHIEKMKSKCDYFLSLTPTAEEIVEIERRVNEIIDSNLPVYEEFVVRDEAAKYVDLAKLSAEAGNLLRIIHIGNYDACACIGQHVSNTSAIGKFKIISNDFENGRWRVRFKLM